MWIIDTPGQAPQIMSNSPADSIGEFIRRDHPEATIYVCRTQGAHAAYAAHVGETRTELVPVTFPDPDNPGGPDLVGEQPQQVPAGNTVAVDPDGPILIMLDDEGVIVETLPLEAVQ